MKQPNCATIFFWRILSVPESCPKVALRCETAMLAMKLRIWLQKIMMIIRIKNKDDNTLWSNLSRVSNGSSKDLSRNRNS